MFSLYIYSLTCCLVSIYSLTCCFVQSELFYMSYYILYMLIGICLYAVTCSIHVFYKTMSILSAPFLFRFEINYVSIKEKWWGQNFYKDVILCCRNVLSRLVIDCMNTDTHLSLKSRKVCVTKFTCMQIGTQPSAYLWCS